MNDTILNMPRASSSSSEVEKKAPRKRVVRSAPRVASRLTNDFESPRRKAPTSLGGNERVSSKSRKKLYISLVIFLVGFSVAVGIGYSDKGQIDIAGVITERNARVSAGETIEGENNSTSNKVVPVQNNNGLVDGGLVGAGSTPPPEPVPEEVATSTEESSATTTDSEIDAETVEEEVASESGVTEEETTQSEEATN